MKKILFLSTLLAAMLLATSCQKEQELVTLGAVINQPAKTYINDRYPCWIEGDQVYVNNSTYPVSAISGSSAQIADVVGADAYRAIKRKSSHCHRAAVADVSPKHGIGCDRDGRNRFITRRTDRNVDREAVVRERSHLVCGDGIALRLPL